MSEFKENLKKVERLLKIAQIREEHTDCNNLYDFLSIGRTATKEAIKASIEEKYKFYLSKQNVNDWETLTKVFISSQPADSRKWIQRLNDPLKIGIIGGNKAEGSGLNDDVIQDALINSGMYKVIDTAKLVPPNNSMTSSDFPQFLDKCNKKGVKVVIFHGVDGFSKKAQSNHYSGEDVATEHRVSISAKVYSTKKKHLKTEVQISESSSTIQGQTVEEEMKTKQQLLQNGAKKLVLQLLKNDIF